MKITKIIQAVADISKNYSDQFHFFYDGVEVKKGGRGYVIALRIIPSEELKSFRDEVYEVLEDHDSSEAGLREV